MSIISKLVPLAGAAILAAAFSTGASAYQCRTQPEVSVGYAANAGTAMMTGRALWSAAVKSKFGLEWSVYSIAASPTQSCGQAGSGYQCVITAKPCKYVVQ